jgi:hypothetical protein
MTVSLASKTGGARGGGEAERRAMLSQPLTQTVRLILTEFTLKQETSGKEGDSVRKKNLACKAQPLVLSTADSKLGADENERDGEL